MAESIRELKERLEKELAPYTAEARAAWTYDRHLTSAHACLRDCLAALSALLLVEEGRQVQETEKDTRVDNLSREGAGATTASASLGDGGRGQEPHA